MTKTTKVTAQNSEYNLPGISMDINSKGVLQIGEKDINELVDKFGTPLLVFDEKEIRKNINEYLDTFKENYPYFFLPS